MTLPDGLYATLHALTAKDARRLRLDWGIGASGAKITLAESEVLFGKFTRASEHAAKGINVAALQRELAERTARQHTQWAWEQQEKKALKKSLQNR